MATNVTNTSSSPLTGAASPLGVSTQTKKGEMGKDDFLTLLVTQLKNQDPESPADSKEFAVQLAQFTQVEKLISIDQKLSAQSNAVASMAGFLGQQVTLASNAVQVKGKDGGKLQLELGQDASGVTVQLLNKEGAVVGEKTLGGMNKGKQTVSLSELNVPDGLYGVKVKAVSRQGLGQFEPKASVSGIVTGFIPGADPKLIVGGREVSMNSIKEVSVPA